MYVKEKQCKMIKTKCSWNKISSLKDILDKQVSHKTCRLCLKYGSKKIFSDNQDLTILNNIKYVLGIEILESDGKPQHICKSCENIVSMAAQLKQTAEVTQWRLQEELDMVAGSPENDIEQSDNYHGGFFSLRKDETITREWSCSKCSRTFNTKEEFHQHENQQECKASYRCYVCESCGKEFKSLSRLKRHRLIHSGSLQWACASCPYRARTKYALGVHERRHSGARPARCPLCAATFANSSNLASHRRRHLPPRYRCQLCQRRFNFNEALQNHMATQHSTAKPHVCSFCGKAFSTRKMICRHERRVHNRPRLRSGVVPTYLRQDETT